MLFRSVSQSRYPKTQEDAEKIYKSNGKKENDYPLIRVWCKYWQKSDQYLNELLAKAKEDNAPNDAVFLNVLGGKHWVTIEKTFNPELHKLLLLEWNK